MTHKVVTYSIVGIDDILDPAKPFRRVVFLPEGADPAESLKLQHQPRGVLIHGNVAASDPTLAGRFWYVHYKEQPPAVIEAILATAQILHLLAKGQAVWVISGPFRTEKEAYHDMELRWESGE